VEAALLPSDVGAYAIPDDPEDPSAGGWPARQRAACSRAACACAIALALAAGALIAASGARIPGAPSVLGSKKLPEPASGDTWKWSGSDGSKASEWQWKEKWGGAGKAYQSQGGGHQFQSQGGERHHALPSNPEYGPPQLTPMDQRPYDIPIQQGSEGEGPEEALNATGCAWAHYRLPKAVYPTHYNLTIELTALTPPAPIYGVVSIAVKRNMSLPAPSCLVFHVASDVTIDDMQVCDRAGGKCSQGGTAFYNPDWSQMQVELVAPVTEMALLRVAFHYELRDKLTGLYHSKFVGVGGEEHSIATTQHEAVSARETFPCWDEPGFKATFNVALHVPDKEGTVALANMPAVASGPLQPNQTLRADRPLPEGMAPELAGPLKRVEFSQSPRMSTYLLAFTVGNFESITANSSSGVMLRAWAPAATQQVGKLQFALNIAKKALDEYERMLGVPFPLPKIDIVSIPDFGPGAMENWGLITYRATAVLADSSSAPHDRQSVAATVVHELGHQWTGNLVTMGWWDELWLNEGFANYFEQVVTDAVEPRLMLLRQHVQYLSRALRFDGSPDTHAVRPSVAINSDSGISSLFDAISYDKAGAVIYMMHDYLERTQPGAFGHGLKKYLEAHKFGTGSGADMWAALGKASGLPIGEWVEPWFSQLGYPLIEVLTLSDGSAVLLQTGRFMQDLTHTQIAFNGKEGEGGDEVAGSWFVPLTYRASTGGEMGVRVGSISSTNAFFTVPPERKKLGGFDEAGTDWLKVNYMGTGYYRVNYPPHLWKRLVGVAAEPTGPISDADLANLIDDAFALTLNGRLSGVTLSLARSLGVRTAHEDSFVSASYESWLAMSAGLHTFLNLLSNSAQAGMREGLVAGPGIELIPRRCVGDFRRFVRTQVLGRCLDNLLMTPPTKLAGGGGGAGTFNPAAESRGRTRTQLEALAPAVVLNLASSMADTRVGVWVYDALRPCLHSPEEKCALIEAIPPDLRHTCLAVCAAFDASGSCWRLMLGQLPFADKDPAYRFALMAALADAPTMTLFNRTLWFTVDSAVVRPQDISSMISLLANNARLVGARTAVWEFAKANVQTLSASGGGAGAFGFSSVLQSVGGGFASEEMAQDVQIFLELNEGLNVPDRIVRAVMGKIRSQAIWLENYGADTCAVLAAYHA